MNFSEMCVCVLAVGKTGIKQEAFAICSQGRGFFALGERTF